MAAHQSSQVYRRAVSLTVAFTFFMSSCVTPSLVVLSSPLEGTEFVHLGEDGTPLSSNRIYVERVYEGYPAIESGVLAGDQVLSINGEIPLTASHAMSLLEQAVRATLVISTGNDTQREVRLERRGFFGLSMASDRESISMIEASGPTETVLVTHRYHKAFREVLTRSEKGNDKAHKETRTLGGVYLGAGGAIGLLGLMATLFMKDAVFEIDGHEVSAGVPTLGISAIFGALGTGMLIKGNEKIFPAQFKVAGSRFAETSLYDGKGYNLVTGLDLWGVTKDGRFPDGSRFSGKVVQGKKEGAGTYTTADGSRSFTGSFSADLIEGLGIERAASAAGSTLSFFGTYQKGQRNGPGVEFDAQGRPEKLTRYAAGKATESAAYPPEPVIGAGRQFFLGAGIKDGLADGAGKVLSLDGRVSQEGTFRQGHLVSGKKTLSDGGVQQGSYTNGQLTQGNWRRPNGTAAEGTWVDGRVQSPAKLWSSNGDVYTGPFDSAMLPDGSGSMEYASGDSYRGTFLGGRPQGTGTYTFKNGDYYAGEFQNGTFNGQGKLVRKGGETIEGGFLQGVPHGMAIYKLGSVVERAEYYEGSRIDQAFQIRQAAERERIRQEEERLAAEQRRREDEARRKREAEEREEREYQASLAQSSQESSSGQDFLAQLQQTTSDFSAWADQNSAEFDATLRSIESYNQSVREANARTSSSSSYPSYSSGSPSSSSSSSSYSSASGSGSTSRASTTAPAPSYQAPSSSGSFGGGAPSSSASSPSAATSAAKPAAETKEQRWNAVVSSFGTIAFPVRLDPARQVGNYKKHSVSLPLTIGPRRSQFGTPATLKIEWDLFAEPNSPNSFIRIWAEQNKSTLFVGNQQYSVPGAGLDSSIVPSLGQGQTVDISFDVFDATDSRLGRLSVQEALLGARPSVGKLIGYLKTKLENSGQIAKGATIQGPLKIGNIEVTGISFTQSQYNAFLTHYRQALTSTW